MASTGDLSNLSALRSTLPPDSAETAGRRSAAPKVGQGPTFMARALAGRDTGAQAFQTAAYDPVGAVSFEWQPLSEVTALARTETRSPAQAATTPPGPSETPAAPTPIMNSVRRRMANSLVFQGLSALADALPDLTPTDRNRALIRNARTMVAQLADLRQDVRNVDRCLDRFEAALASAEAAPDERANWETLYREMLNLRSNLKVYLGQLPADDARLAKAAAAFASDPARLQALLENLGQPDVRALQRHRGVAETGTVDGTTFLSLEMMLLEEDAVAAGSLDDVANAVATRQITDVLGQACLVRDLKNQTLAQALAAGGLSAEARQYLASQGYRVDGVHLINVQTNQPVPAGALANTATAIVGFAKDTLQAELYSLAEDEAIHIRALSTEQQDSYRELRESLDQVVAQTPPATARGAALQIFVSQLGDRVAGGNGGGAANWRNAPKAGPVSRQPLTFDRPTLQRWRTSGLTETELANLPPNIRRNVEPFLQRTPEGGYRLDLSDSDMDAVLRVVDFVQNPPNDAARELVASVKRVATQAMQLQSLAQALQVDLAALERARLLSHLAARPRPHPAPSQLDRSAGIAWQSRLPARPQPRSAAEETAADAERLARTPGFASQGGKAAAPVKTGIEAYRRLEDEKQWTARLTAQRFAQQVRNQQGLAQARAEREAYAASLTADGPAALPVVSPLLSFPTPDAPAS